MEALADTVRDMGKGVSLSSIDVSCAYTKTCTKKSVRPHQLATPTDVCLGNGPFVVICHCLLAQGQAHIYIYWHCMDLLVVCTLKIPELSGLTGTLNTATKTLCASSSEI